MDKKFIENVVKECIAFNVCVQTQNGTPVGFFLDEPAINKIAIEAANRISSSLSSEIKRTAERSNYERNSD